MSTLSQLMTQRAAAGVAYASAVDALKTAYENLAALDRTIENRNVGGSTPMLSFLRDKNALDDLVRFLQHAEFAPSFEAGLAGPDHHSVEHASRIVHAGLS